MSIIFIHSTSITNVSKDRADFFLRFWAVFLIYFLFYGNFYQEFVPKLQEIDEV
ncbi:hypothetical protein LEP1GSC040_3405 [Leptospira santarosai str. 2000030832]|nr:hypothetical protein LEP1GSC040_3405 [Leptospira santarosai str. 2000030832]